MRQKRGVNRAWLYIFAIAVLILFMVLFFGDKIEFSPKGSADKTVSATEASGINFLGLDEKIDRRGQKIVDAFVSAVAEARE